MARDQPRTEFVRVEYIDLEPGRRVPSPEAVERLARSMAEIGLRTPITVRYFEDRPSVSGSDDSFVLVAGAHRLAAAKKLGWEEIECFMANGASDEEAELWEIDENLCRAELSEAEEAAAIFRRKELYELMHPETKVGAGTGGRAGKTKNDFAKLAKSNQPADRFTADTAAKTGKTERTIQRAAKRGKEIGAEVLNKIAGTSLDKGVELDALAALPLEKRMPLIARAMAGEAVTARPQAPEPRKPSGCCPHCGAPRDWRARMEETAA